MNQQEQAMEQQVNSTHIPYHSTGYFSKTIIDYLDKSPSLQPFYQHPASLQGISNAIEERSRFQQHRDVLVQVLLAQYQNITVSNKVRHNIELLSRTDTFTITTAHQPVIFTGPLYFAYKILHTVKLAEDLARQLPQYQFVPVFYMGSEDADLDELGTTYVDGKQYRWNTNQTGAVGRMVVDKALLQLLQELENQLHVLPHGSELTAIFRRCYRPGISIQQATLEVVNELYGQYGVVVLIPDHPELKRLIQPVIEKEITEQFSHRIVSHTLSQLSQHYKVQAGGRELNLFYLTEGFRERIESNGSRFEVANQNLHFSKEELLAEISLHPERFSPNVILRGVLQETILPNIAFVGGGGEMAYWLELKHVFAAVGVPYPVLVLRNSFLFVDQAQAEKISGLGFSTADFFKDTLTLINELVQRTSKKQTDISPQQQEAAALFSMLQRIAKEADESLADHVSALWAQTEKKLIALQKKILKAERRRYAVEYQQIETLKQQLFPGNSLQERKENISGFYARYGERFIHEIYAHSLTLQQQFTLVTL